MRQNDVGDSVWMRENASNCCVSFAPRWTAVENLIEPFCDVVVVYASADQVEIAADDHQEVVEVVSKAARQLPDNFHFLRLVQKRLSALPHRDLVGEPNTCVLQLLRTLSQLAEIRHDAAHDASALVVRQGASMTG